LVSTTNFDVVTDQSFSSVSLGDLFDSINDTLYTQLVSNKDALLHNYINTARTNTSSYEGVFDETNWDKNSVMDI